MADMVRYLSLELAGPEFDLLEGAKLRLQAQLGRKLSWPEFFLQLARGVA